MTKNQTKLEDATADHAEKLTAVADAEALVTEAAQLQVLADAATMSADAKGLDRAITAAATAAARVDILGRKLVIARDREAAAAQVVKAEQLVELEQAAALASSKLTEEDEAITATVQDLVSQLLGAWEAARVVLRSAGAAATAVARAKGSPAIDQRGLIQGYLKTNGSGNVDALASTQALVSYLNAAPQRAAEQRQREEAKVAAKTQADMAGTNGVEAQDAARIAARDFMVANAMTYVGTERVREHRQAPAPRSESDIFAEAVG